MSFEDKKGDSIKALEKGPRDHDSRDDSGGLNGGEILLADGNCGWRACYGVAPYVAQEVGPANTAIQQQAPQIAAPGLWRPAPSKLRKWTDPLDDPNMNRVLQQMQRQGLPYSPGPAGTVGVAPNSVTHPYGYPLQNGKW